jgi:hypothetical protein
MTRVLLSCDPAVSDSPHESGEIESFETMPTAIELIDDEDMGARFYFGDAVYYRLFCRAVSGERITQEERPL